MFSGEKVTVTRAVAFGKRNPGPGHRGRLRSPAVDAVHTGGKKIYGRVREASSNSAR